MSISRRSFFAPNGADANPARSSAPVERAAKPLRILFLGGTGFIGPHQVEYAIKRGHKVTLFNRGKSAPGMFPEAEHLEGDRDGKLGALKGKKWDAVIDNSGYVPRHVKDSAQLLKDAVGHYLFVSTVGVYGAWYDGKWPTEGVDESSPTAPLPEPASENVEKYYGQLKAVCEQELLKVFPKTATIVRPGLIVGPLDPTDRFTYWPVRVDRGGEVMAPGSPSDPVLYIDARDLSTWCVRLVEERTMGTYNALGPLQPFSMAEMLYGCRAVTSAAVSFTWVGDAAVAPGAASPMALIPWLSPKGPIAGASRFRRDRAFAAGLTFRPFAETARDTLTWFKSLPADRQAKAQFGLAPEHEAKILASWRAKNGR